MVPIRDLVELRQGMSRKDPIAAKKLNALNSKMECPNYRVRQAEHILQDTLVACTFFDDQGPSKASQRPQVQSIEEVLTTSRRIML